MEPSEPTPAAVDRWPIAVFSATILLGAFLLFQVQPLVSKTILPWFGGCPAVWTTCLVFFQSLLFGGYLYAHLLQRRLTPYGQVAVHVAVVVVALFLLPIAPGPAHKPADISHPALRILWLLSVTVGLPYFALSATSPLVQAWFSMRCPGRSPYRLYALSNFGSLAALLSYPFVFEPSFDVPRQSMLWSWAFVGYAALCTASLACLWQSRTRQAASAEESPPSEQPRPGWFDRLCWLGLPACASLMLLAATNHVCQDVAVVPFLWVFPLSLYLLSFILCFDHQRWYLRGFWATAAALSVVAVAAVDCYKAQHTFSLMQELTLNLVALFCVCMVCHGELVRRKPAPRYLTEFYLVIAAGGALGGILVGLVAPVVFSTYLEWPIGMVLSVVLALGLLMIPGPPGRMRWLRYGVLLPPAIVGLCYVVYWEFDAGLPVDRARNFFGVVTVKEYFADDPERHEFLLKHGRITHGCQFADPVKRRWPTTYYGTPSGVGQAIRYLQKSGPIRIGAIGLGCGTLAAYARPGDFLCFYEINPEVLRMARAHFTYLADCRGRWDVVLGDARLSLEAEPPQRYNLLVLDAFSGDAIPTHLLTREAFDIYQRHLAPGGIIAVHISNTYLRLAPVVRGLAEHCGMRSTKLCAEEDDARLLDNNDWMLLTRDAHFVQTHPSKSDDDNLHVPLWTDQYSNLFQILCGGIRGMD
jgi:hypothetical protein